MHGGNEGGDFAENPIVLDPHLRRFGGFFRKSVSCLSPVRANQNSGLVVQFASAINFFRLFLDITRHMIENLPSGKQCRLLARIAKSAMDRMDAQVTATPMLQALILEFLHIVIELDDNKLGYRIPCAQPSDLGRLITGTILDRWLLPLTSLPSPSSTLPSEKNSGQIGLIMCKSASPRCKAYELMGVLLEKGMSQFSPGTFLKTVLMPVLTRLQEKHEEMEWMILKSNAKMEREVRCEHEQLAREYENKGQARQARALLLMLSKKEQAEQERRQSQLQIMQMETVLTNIL